jgi:hypothetical protein
MKYNSLSDEYEEEILRNKEESEKLKKELEQKYNNKEKELRWSI